MRIVSVMACAAAREAATHAALQEWLLTKQGRIIHGPKSSSPNGCLELIRLDIVGREPLKVSSTFQIRNLNLPSFHASTPIDVGVKLAEIDNVRAHTRVISRRESEESKKKKRLSPQLGKCYST